MNGRDEHDPPLTHSLTPREEEILVFISEGKTNRQIAEELTVALNTVKWYARQIYSKLGVDGREAAVARARELGLLPEEELEKGFRHNLPAAATPFIGREHELAALAALIADPHARLITITGPGGIGKTRLALEAAGRELRPTSPFPDGVFFVSLAPLETAAEIAATMAAVLDFHFQGSGSEQEQLLNYLAQKQMLLVMDNIEHIPDGRSLLAEIDSRAGGVRVLVTSRERLQLRGEQIFPLGGLETPPVENVSEEAPADYAAAQLFITIARHTVPDFQLFEGDAGPLLRICRMVEGMPLALELAASWAGLLPMSEIAAEIEQNLDLLTTRYHDVPRRHRSMQAALDVSWKRLSPEQQRAFKELTTFRGGFTRASAVGVAGATLPLLVTLVNKSWLTYERQADRYNIHELLRQYGAASLSANPGHEQSVRKQHSAYFCDYLQKRETDWLGARQLKAAAEVREDVDNIQRAWRWAASEGNGLLLAKGLNSLCRFYFWEGRLNDGNLACRTAAEGLSKSLARNSIARDDIARDDIAAQQSADPQHLAWLSQVLAWHSIFVDDVSRKEHLLAESQELLDRAAQSGPDTREEQAFLYLTKAYAAENRDFDEAISFARQALPLFQELGDQWGEAEACAMEGADSIFQGAYDRARDLLSASLEIRQQLGDKQGIAESTVYLGIVARHQGHFDEAKALDRQCLKLYRQLGNKFRQAWCLSIHSYTLSWAGDFTRAREAAGQAAALDRDLGQAPNPWSLNPLAKATEHLGSYADARSIAAESLAIARQIGHLDQASWALLLLGEIALVERNLDEAKRNLMESAAILADMQHNYQAIPRAILSYVFRDLGDQDTACDTLVDALHMAHKYRSISPTICCLPAAALLAADNGQPKKAAKLYGLSQQFAYVGNSHWFTDVACKELDGVRASLPAEVATAVEARGREANVWQTAEALLNELDGNRA